ncbi:DUF3396 domain-containing protein [Myxococcaceae bacterium GXIMD 01537]
MKLNIPHIRVRDGRGREILREGIVLSFYMPHAQKEIAAGVWRAIQHYRQFIPTDALQYFLTNCGEWSWLVGDGWNDIHEEILDIPSHLEAGAVLVEREDETGAYNVEYSAKSSVDTGSTLEVSALDFTLPIAALEERGPSAIRELALSIAAELPLSFGYVSPAFVSPGGVTPMLYPAFLEYCARYPGMDAYNMRRTSNSIGTGARGAYWLTFLGEPLLGQLGGAEGLRQRLPPSVKLVPAGEGRLCVALGEWPVVAEEPGSNTLEHYRALARLLEPHFREERTTWLVNEDFQRQWHRRFLTAAGRVED